jgi:hypothetical protein
MSESICSNARSSPACAERMSAFSSPESFSMDTYRPSFPWNLFRLMGVDFTLSVTQSVIPSRCGSVTLGL